jgi:hypothetical protein
MYATALLRQQHREIEQIFDGIVRGEGDPLPLLDELAAHLPAHMSVEHACLYPVATAMAPTLIAESFEEHAIIELALKRLMITTIGTEEYRARITVLKELLDNHLKDEEASLFPQLEASLTAEELEALGDEMQIMHAALLEQAAPHERAGASGTWPIVGGGAGNALDRTG